VRHIYSCTHKASLYDVLLQLRAIWYTIEAAAQENANVDSGCICIGWDKSSTLSDFDPKLFGPLSHFEKNCWPIKIVARHVCHTPNMLLRVMKPVIMALMDKEARARIIVHAASDSDILGALLCYGIHRNMLPTEMGGSVQLNQAEWIENRRAIELEEICIT